MKRAMIICLILGVAACGLQPAGAGAAPADTPSAEPKADAAHGEAAAQPRDPAPRPIVVNVQPAPRTEEETRKEERERQEKAHLDARLVELTGDLAYYTKLLAWATMVLTVATAGLFAFAAMQARDAGRAGVAARDSADAARRSADAGHSASRPWVGLVSADLVAGLTVARGTGSLTFECCFMNYGASLAVDVRWRFACQAVDPAIGGHDWLEAQAGVLDDLDRDAVSFRTGSCASLVPRQKIMTGPITESFELEGLERYVAVITGGCRYLVDGRPHWTGVVFTVVDHAAGDGEGIPVAHGSRTMSQLRVVRVLTGGRVT